MLEILDEEVKYPLECDYEICDINLEDTIELESVIDEIKEDSNE